MRELWDAVQAQLKRGRQGQPGRPGTNSSSLLTGLVFDASGDRLTPTYATKGTRRYRYYFARRLTTEGRNAAAEALRVPASELEQALCRGLAAFLEDRARLTALLEEQDLGRLSSCLSCAQEIAQELKADAGTGLLTSAQQQRV